jgi:hypothetical protein
MTGAAIIHGGNMIGRLAHDHRAIMTAPVMTAFAIVGDTRGSVIKVSDYKAGEVGGAMAYVTIHATGSRHMRCRLACGNHPVMAGCAISCVNAHVIESAASKSVT